MSLSGLSDHSLLFFLYLGGFLLFTSFFYGIGRLLLRSIVPKVTLVKFSFLQFTFLSLFTGVLFFSVMVSLLAAGFKTVQIGYVALFVVGWLTVREKKHIAENGGGAVAANWGAKPPKKLLGLLALAFFLYYLVQFYYSVICYNFPYYQPSADLTFYSTVADYLVSAGYENVFHVFGVKDESFRHVVPYHYYELWLTGGISKVTGLNTFLVLTLIVSPLFYFIILLGVLSLIEAVGVSFSGYLLVCLLFPLMDRLRLGFFENLPLISHADPFNSLLLSVANNNVSKIGPYYVFLIPATLFALLKQYRVAILFALGLPVATITAAPAVLAGLASALVLLFLAKKITFKNALVYGGYVLVGSVILGGFYLIHASAIPTSGNEQGLFYVLTDFSQVKTKINLFVGIIIILLSVYLPFILLYAYGRWKSPEFMRHWDVIAFVFLNVTVMGLLAWAVLSHLPNSSQLGARISTSLFNLVLFVSTVLLLCYPSAFFKRRVLQTALMVLFTGWLLFNGYAFAVNFSDRPRIAEQYGNTVKEILQASPEERVIGCFISRNDFEKSEVTKNSNYFVIGQYLSLFGKGYRSVSLSDYSIPDENPYDDDDLSIYARDGLFYDFVEDQKKDGTFVSLEKSQLDFIKENNLRYLILSENFVVPKSLEPYVQAEYRDNISKERFVVLRKL